MWMEKKRHEKKMRRRKSEINRARLSENEK